MMNIKFFKRKVDDHNYRYQIIGNFPDDDGYFLVRTIYYDDVRNRITNIEYTKYSEELRGYLIDNLEIGYGYREISEERCIYEVLNFYKEDYEP